MQAPPEDLGAGTAATLTVLTQDQIGASFTRMGTYIQVGVCTDVTIYRAALAKVNLAAEDAVRRLSIEFADMSGFIAQEDDDELRWTLPRALIEEGLVPFLRAQYALFGHHAPDDSEAILAQIAEAGSYDRILALAKGRSMPEFQASTMGEVLSLGLSRHQLPVRAKVLVYLIEGKALMEDYGQLFAYVEALIRMQRSQFPIAAAVKVFLE